MKFWDSSAVIPLLVFEAETEERERQFRASDAIVVWWGTRIEIRSALHRRRREGALGQLEHEQAQRRLEMLTLGWSEVEPQEMVRERAERLLGAHPLRSADALQLAAALIACSERTAGATFHTADVKLAKAAAAEGFTVE